MQIAWRSSGSVADTDTTTGDDRSQAQGSTAAAERAARIAATVLATVELAQADPRAFAPLYTRYAPIVLNYCRGRIADPDAAADATSPSSFGPLWAVVDDDGRWPGCLDAGRGRAGRRLGRGVTRRSR